MTKGPPLKEKGRKYVSVNRATNACYKVKHLLRSELLFEWHCILGKGTEENGGIQKVSLSKAYPHSYSLKQHDLGSIYK